MPLARMKVSRPRSTFLSWRIAARMSSGARVKPGMSRMRVGRPTAFRCASTRAGVLPRAQAKVAGETERRGHADRDALAMDEARRIIAGQVLKGMAKGVPEVEQRALALLGFVGGDDARLGRAADRDRFGAGRPAGEHVAPVRLPETRKSRGRRSART